MTAAHDWKLTFSCPTCRRSSQVAGEVMGRVLRCPHCRSKVVIRRAGMELASQPRPPKPAAESSAKHSPSRGQTRCRVPSSDLTVRVVCGCVAAALGAAMLLPAVAIHLGRPVAGGNGQQRDLTMAAESFQSAWLCGDIDAARAYVVDSDQLRLAAWVAPRRAALAAGFGAKFQAKIVAVEVTAQHADQAEVRVAFEIRGRAQQTFQRWQRTDGGWRLTLDESPAP